MPNLTNPGEIREFEYRLRFYSPSDYFMLRSKAIESSPQMTLNQIRIAYDLSKIKPMLDELKKQGSLSEKQTLLHEASTNATSIMNKLGDVLSLHLGSVKNHTMQTTMPSELDSLYSEKNQLNLEPLISEEGKSFLKEKLGENWSQELNKLYKAAERAFHDDAICKNAGVNDVPSFLVHIDESEFYANDKTVPLLCAPFAAKTFCAALDSVNKQLNREIFQIPQNMDTVRLNTFINTMKEKGCIQEVTDARTARPHQ